MTSAATKALALCAGCSFVTATLLLTATPSHSRPAGPIAATLPPAPPPVGGSRWASAAPAADTIYDNDPSTRGVTEAAPLARRCHLGRLVGGLIGGGVGYASSRKEGRSWAVPLGALLGSQVGCNLGAGRGPLPW
ncbi:MAG: hypothetical protein ACK6AD_12740 [Cyanobacteriota bacterium]|jgi:hypothetical protein